MADGEPSPLEVAAVNYVRNANQETLAALQQAARDYSEDHLSASDLKKLATSEPTPEKPTKKKASKKKS